MATSTIILDGLNESALDTELAHDVVNSVVVLMVVNSPSGDSGGDGSVGPHSFANTPLKAAQPPLAMATSSQVDLALVTGIIERWDVDFNW
jgi:hypothetical protein